MYHQIQSGVSGRATLEMCYGGIMSEEEGLEVENPAEALRNRNGTFTVISPYGNIFQVTCRRGSMRVREIGKTEAAAHPEFRRWRIEKAS